MKTLFLLMWSLVASSASFANATEPSKPTATASVIGADKVKLFVAPEKATGTITLQDGKGHVLFSNNVDLRNGIQQKFDISRLTKGVYQFSVSVGKEHTVQSFSVTDVPSQPVITLQGE